MAVTRLSDGHELVPVAAGRDGAVGDLEFKRLRTDLPGELH